VAKPAANKPGEQRIQVKTHHEVQKPGLGQADDNGLSPLRSQRIGHRQNHPPLSQQTPEDPCSAPAARRAGGAFRPATQFNERLAVTLSHYPALLLDHVRGLPVGRSVTYGFNAVGDQTYRCLRHVPDNRYHDAFDGAGKSIGRAQPTEPVLTFGIAIVTLHID
jgi:hypothetical protein